MSVSPGRAAGRAVRLGAVVGITVTGILAWFVLRPLLNLHGANYVADKFVDIVVPLIAVAGWVVFGPRRGSRATPCGASSCGRSLGSATPC